MVGRPTGRMSREVSSMDYVGRLFETQNMPFLIPICGILMCCVAILVGGVIRIFKMILVHRERMAKIAHGIDPDYRPGPDPAETSPGVRS